MGSYDGCAVFNLDTTCTFLLAAGGRHSFVICVTDLTFSDDASSTSAMQKSPEREKLEVSIDARKSTKTSPPFLFMRLGVDGVRFKLSPGTTRQGPPPTPRSLFICLYLAWAVCARATLHCAPRTPSPPRTHLSLRV